MGGCTMDYERSPHFLVDILMFALWTLELFSLTKYGSQLAAMKVKYDADLCLCVIAVM
jgi:hypothetical protein